ncbi:Galectin [Dirofilaria immitis]|nr:Galectin [Dirofilaria immitis]
MSSILRKLFKSETKKITQKNSITGRNNSFPVPYLSKLEGNQLQPGQSLIVRGYIIGIKDDENDSLDNRLLAIRANIALKRIYFNACIDGEWGSEGSVKHKWSPGDEFDIRIRCHEKYFEIFADHKLLAKFAYYVPISNISHIYMNGDAELYTVSWEGKYYVTNSYTADIPGNFYPGRKLYVSGFAKNEPNNLWLIFILKLIRNTRSEERWGTEEKELEIQFPFKKKRAFDLLFYCDENRFLCHVDDCLVCSYTHRMSPRDIDKLSIDGDIDLQGVHLK